MAYYLKQESKKGLSANWIVRDFEQIDGDILKSRKQNKDIVYHFACLSDNDMNVTNRDRFPWPLDVTFFEVALDPIDWKYRYIGRCTEKRIVECSSDYHRHQRQGISRF